MLPRGWSRPFRDARVVATSALFVDWAGGLECVVVPSFVAGSPSTAPTSPHTDAALPARQQQEDRVRPGFAPQPGRDAVRRDLAPVPERGTIHWSGGG